jgi:thiamine biosynthesis lipoprotein ApbE
MRFYALLFFRDKEVNFLPWKIITKSRVSQKALSTILTIAGRKERNFLKNRTRKSVTVITRDPRIVSSFKLKKTARTL